MLLLLLCSVAAATADCNVTDAVVPALVIATTAVAASAAVTAASVVAAAGCDAVLLDLGICEIYVFSVHLRKGTQTVHCTYIDSALYKKPTQRIFKDRGRC